jgi:hypothetical protein
VSGCRLKGSAVVPVFFRNGSRMVPRHEDLC